MKQTINIKPLIAFHLSQAVSAKKTAQNIRKDLSSFSTPVNGIMSERDWLRSAREHEIMVKHLLAYAFSDSNSASRCFFEWYLPLCEETTALLDELVEEYNHDNSRKITPRQFHS